MVGIQGNIKPSTGDTLGNARNAPERRRPRRLTMFKLPLAFISGLIQPPTCWSAQSRRDGGAPKLASIICKPFNVSYSQTDPSVNDLVVSEIDTKGPERNDDEILVAEESSRGMSLSVR